MQRWPPECRSPLGALFAPHAILRASPSCPIEQSRHYEAGIQTAHTCYLKDDETRSVLINWSGHQTKRTQKAEPDTVIDEQIYYIRLQREPRSKHITQRVKLEIHDVMGATCPAHKYRLMKVRLLMHVWIITACVAALIITAASSLCARVDF